MDKDYLFIQDRIMEAQRLRNEALGELIASACHGAIDLIGRGFRLVSDALRPRHPVHH